MKIGHGCEVSPSAQLSGPAAAAPDAVAAAAKAGTPATAGAATAEASAKVELSSTVQALRTESGDATFDAEKVARISQSIADGTFTIDAGAIADKLIANAQEVLAKVGR